MMHLRAQKTSPTFTAIYTTLIGIIDTKLPECGELLLKRVILGFRNAYKTRDRSTATVLVKFIAHLVNQQIAHEVLALQLVTILLENPTKQLNKQPIKWDKLRKRLEKHFFGMNDFLRSS